MTILQLHIAVARLRYASPRYAKKLLVKKVPFLILITQSTIYGKFQICLSTLSKLTTGLQWYQNHSNFHCYRHIQIFLIMR
jgi:hypothetical protein